MMKTSENNGTEETGFVSHPVTSPTKIYVTKYSTVIFISNRSPDDVIITYCARGPFYWHGLTLILASTNNYIDHYARDEITDSFSNFNGVSLGI